MRPSMPSAPPRVPGAQVRGTVLALAFGVATLAAASAVEAWPAIQDDLGRVFLCDTRPAQLSDGRWACRSAGANLAGGLVDVVRPGMPPGARPWWDGPPGARPRWWGPPPREPSGYDALDPWLGGGGSSER